MLGTYAAAALLCAAALIVGQAVCVLLLGRRAPYGGAIGLAGLILTCSVAIRLPGDATTAALAVAALTVAGAALLARRRALRPAPLSAAVGALTLLGASVPFLANGRVGLLGVGFNNDTSLHLLWAEGLRDDRIKALAPAADSYPLGPHALATTLAQATGIDLDLAFTAVLIVVPVLTALAALAALRRLPAAGRLVGAPLAGLAYLAAAYGVQGAFKETIVACFVLTFAVALEDVGGERAPRARTAALLGLPIAAALYAFSYAAAAWFGATFAIWLVLDLLAGAGDGGVRAVRARARALAAPLAAGVGVAAVAVIPELGNLTSFLDAATSSVAGASSGGIAPTDLGNLAGPLHLWEALGIWLGPDFRVLPPRDPLVTGIWSGVAAVAVTLGAAQLLARRRFALPAAVAACALIYWRSKAADESPYVTAKALAIAAPVVMATTLAGLWDPLEGAAAELRGVRLGRGLLLAAFVLAAGASSFSVLRGASVNPSATKDELARLRPLLGRGPTLFLGNDDYYAWKLRGTPAGEPAYTTPIQVDLRPEKAWEYPQPRDFDSVTPQTLDRFTYVITPRSPYASEPPANFRRVRDTRLFTLWRRSGPTPARATVPGERGTPGGILDCDTAAGRALVARGGVARVRPAPIGISGPPGPMLPGATRTLPFHLPPGRWTLSMPYLGAHGVTVEVGDLRARLPADLDRPGSVYELGTVTIPRSGAPRTMTVTIDDPAPGFLHSRTHLAYVGNVLAVRAGAAARTVPLRAACGRWVDWYRPAR